jgi:hypothetical protein
MVERLLVERLLLALPFWVIGVAYMAIGHRYSPANLLLVAAGSALTLIAVAVNPDDWVVISLAALGAGLWVRGADAEKRRRRERRGDDGDASDAADGPRLVPR